MLCLCVMFHGRVISFSFWFFGGRGFSLFLSLQEADGSYVHPELLVGSSDVHGRHVHDGQTGGLLCLVLEHRLAPLACVRLLVENSRETCHHKRNVTTSRGLVTTKLKTELRMSNRLLHQ